MSYMDLHVHTRFSDGRDMPEDMVKAAIGMGLHTIGFSEHAPMKVSANWTVARERLEAYRDEIKRLNDKYSDKIRVLCGLEMDYYSDEDLSLYDYAIGSVHYVRAGNVYCPVDEAAEVIRRGVTEQFGGDADSFAEAYFKTVGDVIRKTGANIVGHFDLLTKFQELDPLFNLESPRYVDAWTRAIDSLGDVIYEMNTGAISRGQRTTPYPAPDMLAKLKKDQRRLILSSDTHRCENIKFQFEESEALLLKNGFHRENAVGDLKLDLFC